MADKKDHDKQEDTDRQIASKQGGLPDILGRLRQVIDNKPIRDQVGDASGDILRTQGRNERRHTGVGDADTV